MALGTPYSTLLFGQQGISEPNVIGPSGPVETTWVIQYGTFYCDSLDGFLSIGEFSLDVTGTNQLTVNPIYGTWDVTLWGVVLSGVPQYYPGVGGTARIFRLGTLTPGMLPYTADHNFKIVLCNPGD